MKLVAEDELQLRLPLRYFSLTRGFPRATGYEILNMIRRAGWLTNQCELALSAFDC